MRRDFDDRGTDRVTSCEEKTKIDETMNREFSSTRKITKTTHLSHFGSQLIFGPRCHRAVVLLSHHEEWGICKSNASPHLRNPKPFLISNRLSQPQLSVKDLILLLRDIARRLPCTIPRLRNTRRRGPRSGNKVADHVQPLYFNLPTSSRANCKP
jgi:hypothetical protein